MTGTVALTGPQLEVIALLAEGLGVNDIAATTGSTQQAVNQRIWSACEAVGARDRNHLVAIGYRSGLLRVPGVEHLRAALARAEHDVATARQEAKESRHAATDARNAQSVAERKLTTARNDLAAEVERREHLERALEQAPAVDTAEVDRLRRELDEARNALADARASATRAEQQVTQLREELKTVVKSRAGLETDRDRKQEMYQRTMDLLRAEKARADAAEAAAKTGTPTGAQLRAAAGPWDLAISHLERLQAETRVAAQRGGVAMLQTARGVELSIACLRKAARP